jgi:salicylate hydroxylase
MNNVETTVKAFTVTIVGGGIGGIVLAIGLLRRNVQVQIYEAASAFAETGLGLSIGPAAHRAMPLIDPRIRDIYDSLVTTHADSPCYEEFRQTWFEVVWATGPHTDQVLMNLEALPSGQTPVRGADFQDALVNLVPREILHFGKRLQSLDETSNGIILFFEDGTSVTADVVVGCDGIKSRVKEYILPSEEVEKAKPVYGGMFSYRTVLDINTMIEAVGDRRARLSSWYIGKGFYGVTYPIQRAKKVNIGIYILDENGKWDSDTWIREGTREDMERDLANKGKYVNRLMKVSTPIWPSISYPSDISNLPKYIPNASQWAIFEHPLISTFYKSHVALLGDAAHASTPHQGAGAGQAIDDVHVLVELLADPSVITPQHVQAAFHAYDAIRRPRSQRVVTTSKENAEILCLSYEGIGDDPEKLKNTWQERFQWLWDVDLHEQVENARQVMLEQINISSDSMKR